MRENILKVKSIPVNIYFSKGTLSLLPVRVCERDIEGPGVVGVVGCETTPPYYLNHKHSEGCSKARHDDEIGRPQVRVA